MNVTVTTSWECAAEGCGRTHEVTHVYSVFAAMDARTEFVRPYLPLDWRQIEGRAYCGHHTIAVTAVIRTPTRVWVREPNGEPGFRRIFLPGDREERVRLRNEA